VNILEKIQKLIDLTESTSGEEGRNAAVAAVKLIKEHKVLESLMFASYAESRAPRPSPRQSREKIKTQAYQKAWRFIAFLRRKATDGTYPSYEAKTLVDRAVQDGTLAVEHREVFLHYLRQALRAQVQEGQIEYVRGKGYRLRYTLMWETAA